MFATNPVDAVVNGSLWTLGPEFLCYLGVVLIGVLALFGARARPELARLVLFAAIGVALAVLQIVPGATPAGLEDVLRVAVFFAGGAVLAQLDALGLLAPALDRVVVYSVTAAYLVAGVMLPDAADGIAWIVLPFVVVGLGSQSTPYVRRAARFGDLSYGLYLWGFPVQQTVWLLAPGLPLGVDILIVVGVAGLLALASWWLVERRAIALGRRVSTSIARQRDRGSAP